MKVRLLADLTRYKKNFVLGAVGDSPMEPVNLPQVRWQPCYNVTIDGVDLLVGENSLEVLAETEANAIAKLTLEKIHLSEKIESGVLVVLWTELSGKCFSWKILKANQSFEWPTLKKDSIAYRNMMAEFVKEYVMESNIPYIILIGDFLNCECGPKNAYGFSVAAIKHLKDGSKPRFPEKYKIASLPEEINFLVNRLTKNI